MATPAGSWLKAPMPPFANEPAEKIPKGPSFLKQHLRDPVSQHQKRPTLFGAEPAENVIDKPRPKPKPKPKSGFVPFQDELEEGDSSRPNKPTKRSAPSHSLPFQPEQCEDNDGSSSSSEGVSYEKPKDTVFALGWQSLHTFKAGSFWKENMDGVQPKPKRTYDNSKRAATASYGRQENAGSIRANGTDPKRLQMLFESPACQCSPAVHWNVFLFKMFVP